MLQRSEVSFENLDDPCSELARAQRAADVPRARALSDRLEQREPKRVSEIVLIDVIQEETEGEQSRGRVAPVRTGFP